MLGASGTVASRSRYPEIWSQASGKSRVASAWANVVKGTPAASLGVAACGAAVPLAAMATSTAAAIQPVLSRGLRRRVGIRRIIPGVV